MLTLALSLSLSIAAASPRIASPPLVIANVTVIPLDNDDVLRERDVLIRDGRIVRIDATRSTRKRDKAQVVDGTGKFLLPGFIDAHVHVATEGAIRGSKDPAVAALDLGNEHVYDKQVLLSFLRAGVVAAANLGGSVASDDDLLWLRDEVDAGRVLGPRLFIGKRINGPRAAVMITPDGPVPASSVNAPTTAADGKAAVRAAKQRGYDFIKPYQFLNRETYAAVVDEARAAGLPTSGHLPELGCATCADRAFAFAHAMDNIAHAEELGRYGRESDLAPTDIDTLAAEIARRRIAVTPTLITLKTILHMYMQRDVPAVPAPWNDWIDPITRRDWVAPQNRYLSEAFRAQSEAPLFSAGYDFSRVLTRQLWKRGVALTAGTDAALPGLPFGLALHQEMQELREIGLSPLEVLRAASLNARRLFAPSLGSGAARPGERAELVLLDADPLTDIRNTRQIAGVVVRGQWISTAQMDKNLNVYAKVTATIAAPLNSERDAPQPTH